MTLKQHNRTRQRAPSKRSLETRARILDAAEKLFADRGFDGASIRDIASLAGVQGALVNHHGGSKEELFFTVVTRRAEELAAIRITALKTAQNRPDPDLRAVLSAFIEPYLHRVFNGEPEWASYGRLIAHVSSDMRWREISEAAFDPTVQIFLDALQDCLPSAPRPALAGAFVFMVSSMLAISASAWRVDALAGDTPLDQLIDTLLDYTEAGFRAATGA